jgi:hypothetical protein
MTGKEALMPRKTSEINDCQFPFAEDTTPFIFVLNTPPETPFALIAIKDKYLRRGYVSAWTAAGKYDLVILATDLRDAGADCSLLAVWTGANASHVFEIDDLDEARDALG